MVFYDNRKKFMPSPPPPPFLGHLKKKYRAKECCRKKNSCKQLGDEKKFVHRKIAQPPPPSNIQWSVPNEFEYLPRNVRFSKYGMSILIWRCLQLSCKLNLDRAN